MPDKYIVEKDFISNGFRCVVIGTRLGHRCGYIAIPPTHEYYSSGNRSYNDIDIDVHGGLTYSGDNDGYPVKSEDDVFWIGFDCGHSGDGKDYGLISQLNDVDKSKFLIEIEEEFCTGGEVRNAEYVINELIAVTEQL